MEPEPLSSTDFASIENSPSPNNESGLENQYSHKSQIPKIAGIILLLVGILIIVHWVYITMTPDFIDVLMSTGVYDTMNITRADLATVFNFCGVLASGLALFTIMGGILALQRRLFWLAVIGGIVGIFALAPLFFFIPNILSFIGTILLIQSRREFQK